MKQAPVLQRALLIASLAAAPACSSETGTNPQLGPCPEDTVTEGVPLLGADCDPMVPTQCGYPFPSNVYLADDPTTHTGKRVAFGQTTLPGYTPSTHLDPKDLADHDGFSAGQPAITHLVGATIAGLPTQDTIDLSLTDDSPTVIVDAETGERIPHFSELDQELYDEPDEDRALMLRPVVRLKDAHRYLVAIRRVVDKDGNVIAPTPVFKALRDDIESCDVSVTRRRELYADIFARLANAGIARDDLQIAWDYSTASRENNTERLLHMRDDALAMVGPEGPEYSIVSVTENPNPHIRRRILAKMKVPLYLDTAKPGARLVLGEDGLPKQNGTAEFEVLVHIPNAATKGTPGALIQNGHGLLGYKTEGQDGYLAEFADAYNYVAFSVDLVGMAHEDVETISDSAVSSIFGFVSSIERQHQGLLNSLLAMRLMSGRFATEPLTIIDGHHTIDPTHRYYRGDSQGGIFGTTYMSISTDVTRGLLGEPGMPYSLLLNRSSDFGPYFILMRGSFRTGRNIQLVLGLVQMMWDRTEPDGYASYISGDPLPNTPSHEVLIHVAIGDHQVTPLGAHIIAREVGAKNLAPVNRSVWGLEEATGPISGSAMVEFEFGLKESPKENIPPNDTFGPDPHDAIRATPEAMGQSDEFFRTGVIKAYCEGPCNPD